MDPSFWHDRWQTGRIGFHEGQVNDLLAAHFPGLAPPPGAHIFVPLCGAAHDMAWLAARGYRVTGIDLSPLAIERFLGDHGLRATETAQGPLRRFETPSITLYTGDLFALTAADLGPVDFIYDRAALVALPAERRARYTSQLMDITGTAPQLLITFDHDGAVSGGPPFSVPEAEVRGHYGATYEVSPLSTRPLSGPIAERAQGAELVFGLRGAG